MAEDRKHLILVAALDAIEAVGPTVGTGEIAERAGVPRPHVYRYFDSKEALDDAVAHAAANDLLAHVRPRLAPTGTVYDWFGGLVAEGVDWAATHPNLYRFVTTQRQTKALQRVRVGRRRLLSELVAAGTAYTQTGSGSDVSDGVMAGLMGMVDASIIWWLDHADETQEELTHRLTRQIWVMVQDLFEQRGVELGVNDVLPLP